VKKKNKQANGNPVPAKFSKWMRNCLLFFLGSSLLLVWVVSTFYLTLRSNDEISLGSVTENQDFMKMLYRNNLLLNLDLTNRSEQKNLSFWELYTPNVWKEAVQAYGTDNVGNYYSFDSGMLSFLENTFSEMNQNFDYFAQDTKTGTYITNTGEDKGLSPDPYVFYVTFLYDDAGNVSLGKVVKGEDETNVRRCAAAVIREGMEGFVQDGFQIPTDDFESGTEELSEGDLNFQIYHCSITYGLTEASFHNMPQYQDNHNIYPYERITIVNRLFFLLLLGITIFAFITKDKVAWESFPILKKIFSLPMEVSVLLLFFLLMEMPEVGYWLTNADFRKYANTSQFLYLLDLCYTVLCVTALMVIAWYIGTCAAIAKEMKIRVYLRKKSLIVGFFPMMKRKIVQFYDNLQHIDLNQDARKTVFKLVIINGAILMVISTVWVAGYIPAIVYSFILYYILKKYFSDVQKKYGILSEAINEIAKGNLNVTIQEDLGIFQQMKPQIQQIQTGFRKAVEEEMKSQRMKTELITNVSHDLKTPLTAIITYIDLLKIDETRRIEAGKQTEDSAETVMILSEEKRLEYLNTLENKAQRLKVLIEDLFEVSKAASDNITLHIVDVDIINLVKQVALEMSDKIKQANLDLRLVLPEQKIILPLDSQKTYRIYENLFANIAKYALPGTRVYVTADETTEGELSITLKNITEQELSVSPEELTDRFVRGDASRNTEGSGLGLSIAKSFMEVQGGKLKVEIDGDLFKAATIWKRQ
jgi:signal transduction histidine kinase